MQQPVLIEATLLPVLVNGTATVLLHAGGAQPPVLAEAAAATLFALAALPPVLAEAAAATLLAVAVVALPPVLAEAAAAAAFLALAAQPPVLAAAAYLAPHWPQTMRARCATNSQRTKRLARPNRRARRQQIPDPKREVCKSGWGGEKTGQGKR